MKAIDKQKALEKTCFLTRASDEAACCEGSGCMAWENRGPSAGVCLLIPDRPQVPPVFDLCGVLLGRSSTGHACRNEKGCSHE